VRFGLYVDLRNPPRWERPSSLHYGRWLERIEEAERLGAGAVWLTEHHFFDDGYLPQCWTLAAAIAARTNRIRIGTAVTLLPLHPAVDLAEQIAVVDVLSAGRVEAGFGLGYRRPEYVAFGGDFKRRYGVFADRVRDLRRWWGEEPGAERLVTPRPVQSPVPLWGGFGGPHGARTAGRLGLGLQSIDPALLEPYRRGLAEAGFGAGSARMAGGIELFVSDDPERAWAQIGEHAQYRWISYNRHMFEGTPREADPPEYFPVESVRSKMVIGTPDQIVATIQRRVGHLPVTDFWCWADYPGLPDDLTDRHIELLCTEVAPRLATLASEET
jgi:alkanesulfonate monooxygenase SsuD/methylene tetrahydromethanopterin reductase-like flavin-dependent oxidoreductase (luciferase family)